MTAAPPRIVLAVTTYNRADYLRECLYSWHATRDPALPWYVIVADDGSTDGTLDLLYRGGLPFDLHVIRNERRGVGGQTNTIFDVCRTVGFSVLFKIDDDLVFRRPGWDRLYLDAIAATGADHLCHLNVALWNAERRPAVPLVAAAPPMRDASGRLAAWCPVYDCMGCLFTVTPRMLDAIGGIDEANFPVRGDWHIDFSARACRAGFNRLESFYDAAGANDFLELQDTLKTRYRRSVDLASPEMAATLAPAELARRRAVIRDETRVLVRARPRRSGTGR